MRILAIDPGKSGGLAWSSSAGNVYCRAMPETDADTVSFLAHCSCMGFDLVVMELVSGFIGMKQPGSAMFNFGMNFGLLKGSILALGMPLKLVTPQSWQKTVDGGRRKKDFNYEAVLTKGKRKGQSVTKNCWKERLISIAQEKYPELEVTPKTADALLILDYTQNNL